MELRPLQGSAVKEVEVKGGKKAYVVFVPMPQLKAFQRIQQRLTRELEKKFSDHHVVFIGQRRIMGKPTSHSRATQPRPRSRTEDLLVDSGHRVSGRRHTTADVLTHPSFARQQNCKTS